MSTSLRKIPIIENPKYKKSGPKSYVSALLKCKLRPLSAEFGTSLILTDGITPTLDGPFYRGKATVPVPTTYQPFFGARQRLRTVGPLMKKVAGKPASEGVRVTTQDVQADVLYLSEVEIGSPPQKLWLDFDTGSSDLWVFPQDIEPLFRRNDGHHFFSPSKSSTFKQIPGNFEIHFGDGSWAKGWVGSDTLHLGGLDVENQAVELATELHSSFISGEGDGLLGLGFGSINSVKPDPVQTPVENMIAQGMLLSDQRLFTCKLGSWRDAQSESFYTFGFIDTSTTASPVTAKAGIHRTPIDSSNGFWQFPSTTITINGVSLFRPNNTAIADTGTTLTLLDDEVVSAVYAAIPGSRYDVVNQGWVYPARFESEGDIASLPEIRLAVGKKEFYMHRRDLGFVRFRDEEGEGEEWIYGGIQSRGDCGFDILGDSFLKSVYAIFDVGEHQLGLVQRYEPVRVPGNPSRVKYEPDDKDTVEHGYGFKG